MHNLTLKSKHLFSVAAAVTTTTLLSCSLPAQALKSYNFNWADSEGRSVLGSFSYEESLYSGLIGKEQLDSFSISFFENGELKQSHSTISSVFFFEFDTASTFLRGIEAGAFSIEYDIPDDKFDSAPIGSLTFYKLTPERKQLSNQEYDSWIIIKDSPTSSYGSNSNHSPVTVEPSVPSESVPEPQAIAGIALIGIFGTVSKLKHKKELTQHHP